MARRESKFIALISGRWKGIPFDLLRAGLLVLSVPYLIIVSLRNAYYSLFSGSAARVSRPVISVGNITVGGTGKTPMAGLIANLLSDRNLRVAILLRGYKAGPASAPGGSALESDEAQVHKRLCPRAVVMADPDRVGAARRAVANGVDALVLDDGFQHRRIARQLDVVLIDATLPFGYGHLLPRGLLREPARALRRAGLIVLTRAHEIDEADRKLLVSRLRRVSGGKPVLIADHDITAYVDLKGRPAEGLDPAAMKAVVFAGIGNFESFRRGVERQGAQVLASYEYPDHHAYTNDEIASIADVARNMDANIILTTEKDAVKLTTRWPDGACPLLAARAGLRLEADSLRLLSEALDEVLRQS